MKSTNEKDRVRVCKAQMKKEQRAQLLTLMSQTCFPIGYVSSNVRRKTDNNG